MENKKITNDNDACVEKRRVRFSFSDDDDNDDAITVDDFNYDTDEGSRDGEEERMNSKSSARDLSSISSNTPGKQIKESCTGNNNDISKQSTPATNTKDDDHVTSRWSSHGSSSDSSPVLKKRIVDFTRWSSTTKSSSPTSSSPSPPRTPLLA